MYFPFTVTVLLTVVVDLLTTVSVLLTAGVDFADYDWVIIEFSLIIGISKFVFRAYFFLLLAYFSLFLMSLLIGDANFAV